MAKAIIPALLCSAVFSCGSGNYYKATGKAQMKIEFKIVPEGDDTSYSIS